MGTLPLHTTARYETSHSLWSETFENREPRQREIFHNKKSICHLNSNFLIKIRTLLHVRGSLPIFLVIHGRLRQSPSLVTRLSPLYTKTWRESRGFASPVLYHDIPFKLVSVNKSYLRKCLQHYCFRWNMTMRIESLLRHFFCDRLSTLCLTASKEVSKEVHVPSPIICHFYEAFLRSQTIFGARYAETISHTSRAG